MVSTSAPSLEAVKRRQAIQVSLFLFGVGLLTTLAFHLLRPEIIAYRRGHDALRRGQHDVAAQELQRAADGGYHHPALRRDLARALHEQGRTAEALVHYKAALESVPADEALIDTVVGLHQREGNPNDALALLAQLGPPERLSVSLLARLGDVQQQAGRFDDAIKTYQLALARTPREPELLLRLGVVQSWVGRRVEATESLRAAVSMDPSRQFARRYLARVLMWDGRFEEAVAEYRRSLPE
jgi:protein O-GlcNAc transferase